MNQQQTRKENNRRGERGSILATAALSMVSLLLAAGLAIDVSHFYTAKAELQNAADAAALAAASQLSSTSGGITLAVAQATTAMNKFDFSRPLTITSADVTFSKNLNGAYVAPATAFASPGDYRFVKVTLAPQPVNTTFSALVLGNSLNISASATAGLSVGLTMNKFYTAFAFIEAPGQLLVKGASYDLVPKAGNDNSPGSYRILTGSDGGNTGCGGNNSYSDPYIVAGQIHDYGCVGDGYTIPNLPATSTAPAWSMCRYAAIGINTRFAKTQAEYTAIHPGANAADEPPDTITDEDLTYDQYRTRQAGPPQQTNGVQNRRIITLPIGLSSAYNVSQRKVTGNRLAAFFIKKKMVTNPSQTATYCKFSVEYIGLPIAVPMGTYTPGQTQIGDLAVPVLYK